MFQLLGVLVAAGFTVLAQEHDYVIVGGGVAGLVVANRLTEDKTSG